MKKFLILALALFVNINANTAKAYSDCVLQFSSEAYFISKDSKRASDFFYDIRSVIQEQNKMQAENQCSHHGVNPGACQVEYDGTFYYVARGNSRMSSYENNLGNAVAKRDLLIGSQNCDSSSLYYSSSQTCDLKFSSGSYFVSIEGSRFSDLFSNLDSALQLRSKLNFNRICRLSSASLCKIELSGNLFYVAKNGQSFSSYVSSENEARAILNKLHFAGICY